MEAGIGRMLRKRLPACAPRSSGSRSRADFPHPSCCTGWAAEDAPATPDRPIPPRSWQLVILSS